MQEEHSSRTIGGGNGHAFRWLMANCTGLGFSSLYKTMFSEQLPAAARCCTAHAHRISINKIMFSVLYIGKNKNPVVVVAAAAASQGCVEKNTRRVTRTHSAAGRATTMTSTRRRRPSVGVGATRSCIPTMLITGRSGVGPAAQAFYYCRRRRHHYRRGSVLTGAFIAQDIHTPSAAVAATATTTVNGVLVVETRERTQHQPPIAASKRLYLFSL